jgi:hypothetical protein
MEAIPIEGGFVLEEFVDAELHDGNALSWCVELTGTGDGLNLDADVRRNTQFGQEVVSVIVEENSLDVAKCDSQLRAVVRDLCAVRPQELA